MILGYLHFSSLLPISEFAGGVANKLMTVFQQNRNMLNPNFTAVGIWLVLILQNECKVDETKSLEAITEAIYGFQSHFLSKFMNFLAGWSQAKYVVEFLQCMSDIQLQKFQLEQETHQQELQALISKGPPPFSWQFLHAIHSNFEIQNFLRSNKQSESFRVGGGISNARKIAQGLNSQFSVNANAMGTGGLAAVAITKTAKDYKQKVAQYENNIQMLKQKLHRS